MSEFESASGESSPMRSSPVVVIVIGMAGSGKSTLMHRINLSMNDSNKRGYYVNLDPAVKSVPFAANIDIRDTVNYKEVMEQYNLGPNGAILTSLNLFATRFDQVIEILEKRAEETDFVFVDTPGQIEAFTWSAGGQIILELLASTFPTCLLYVSDSARCTSPTTFMSNMLYCCSVLYKSNLPVITVFNKIDAVSCAYALEWMTDFESYLDASENTSTRDGEYMSSLNRSLALVMDEFYSNISAIGVSAATGEGIPDLFLKVEAAAIEFRESYLPELQRRIRLREQSEVVRQQRDLEALRGDMVEERGDKVIADGSKKAGHV